MQDGFVGAMSALLLSSLAGAQDVDVPGNLTMVESTATEGNILKAGVPFIHNFGMGNTFIGRPAGNFTMIGYFNTAIGSNALVSNTTGFYNTAGGAQALFRNTTGTENTAIGMHALEYNTRGTGNTANGSSALSFNAIGNHNTASGAAALMHNTGSGNTATGAEALFHNQEGGYNTASGSGALFGNYTGIANTASGAYALQNNTSGNYNTASGHNALSFNTTGSFNTAIGSGANVPVLSNLTNATAIGALAVVDDSNKIRLGNNSVTVIESRAGFTSRSDRNQQENFQPVNGEEVLSKIRDLSLTSWNFMGHDPRRFRHYGPTAQDFFAAFGQDAVGTIGTPTTITSNDIDGILMIAAQALEQRTVEQRKEIKALRAENTDLKARLEALERRVGSIALTKAE